MWRCNQKIMTGLMGMWRHVATLPATLHAMREGVSRVMSRDIYLYVLLKLEKKKKTYIYIYIVRGRNGM